MEMTRRLEREEGNEVVPAQLNVLWRSLRGQADTYRRGSIFEVKAGFYRGFIVVCEW